MKNQDKCNYSTGNIPVNVVEYCKKITENQTCRLSFVDIIDKINGKSCIRTYCFKSTKKDGLQIKELGREFLKKNFVSEDLTFTYLGGYQMNFGTKKYYQYVDYATNQLSECNNLWYPKLYRAKLYSLEELQKAFENEIPYLKLNEDIMKESSVMSVLRKFGQDHNCELLTKAGFSYLVNNSSAINRLTPAKRKAFSKWLIDNQKFVSDKKPCYSFIMKAIKYNLNAQEMVSKQNLWEAQKALSSFKFDEKTLIEIVKYLNKQTTDEQQNWFYQKVLYYRDCLDMSKQLKRKMDRGTLFPRNLREQHDALTERIDKKKNRKINSVLKKIKPQLDKYALSYKGLQIVIPSCQSDLVALGNELHNCVGTFGYGKKMALEDCIILGVFKDGKPVECCELIKKENKKKLEINQLYGNHNSSTGEYHENAKKLVNKFINAYRPLNLVGGCI